jgi:hypothetical protein
MFSQKHQRMWIEIKKDIFSGNDQDQLNYLLLGLTYNPVNSIIRYNVYVDIEKVENLPLFVKLSNNIKDILREEYVAYNTGSKPKIFYIVSYSNNKNNIFNLEESLRFFKEALFIIVENNKNDSEFMKSVFRHFGIKGFNGEVNLVEHFNNGWIDFDNAGGCGNVKNFIDGKLQKYEKLAFKNGKESSDYYRFFVLLDSDKEYSHQLLKVEYKDLEIYLSKLGSGNYHILQKRMMENYMPDEVFKSLPHKGLRSWKNVYNKLTEEQKNYLNYSSGFSKTNDQNGVRKAQKAEILTLFNIPTADFNILDGGLKYPSFKTKFPLLFRDNPFVNKKTLKARAGSTELEEIITKINALI